MRLQFLVRRLIVQTMHFFLTLTLNQSSKRVLACHNSKHCLKLLKISIPSNQTMHLFLLLLRLTNYNKRHTTFTKLWLERYALLIDICKVVNCFRKGITPGNLNSTFCQILGKYVTSLPSFCYIFWQKHTGCCHAAQRK